MAYIQEELKGPKVYVSAKFKKEYTLSKQKAEQARNQYDTNNQENSTPIKNTEEEFKKASKAFKRNNKMFQIFKNEAKDRPLLNNAKVNYGRFINKDGKFTRSKKIIDNSAIAILATIVAYSVVIIALSAATGFTATPLLIGLSVFNIIGGLSDIALLGKNKKDDKKLESAIIDEKNNLKKPKSAKTEEKVNEKSNLSVSTTDQQDPSDGMSVDQLKKEVAKLNEKTVIQIHNELKNKKAGTNSTPTENPDVLPFQSTENTVANDDNSLQEFIQKAQNDGGVYKTYRSNHNDSNNSSAAYNDGEFSKLTDNSEENADGMTRDQLMRAVATYENKVTNITPEQKPNVATDENDKTPSIIYKTGNDTTSDDVSSLSLDLKVTNNDIPLGDPEKSLEKEFAKFTNLVQTKNRRNSNRRTEIGHRKKLKNRK